MVEMGPTLSSPAFSVKNLSKEKQIAPLLFMQEVIFSISSSCCCNGWVRDDNVTSSVAKPSSWACWIILLCGEHSLTQANFQVWDFAGQSPVSAQMAFAFFYVCAEIHLTKSQTGLCAVLVWKCNLLFQMQTLSKRKINHEEIRYKLCSLFFISHYTILFLCFRKYLGELCFTSNFCKTTVQLWRTGENIPQQFLWMLCYIFTRHSEKYLAEQMVQNTI